MKKIASILFVMLLVCGCNNKNEKKEPVVSDLTCEQELFNGESAIIYNYNFTFEDDNLTKAVYTNSFIYDESKKDLYSGYLLSIVEEYNKIQGVDASLDSDVLTINYDINGMNENDIIESGLDKKKDEIKEIYQNKGYSCN